MGIEIGLAGPDDAALFDNAADEVGTVVAQAAAVLHLHPDKATELYVLFECEV